MVENRGKNKKLVSSLLEGTGSNLTFTNPANTKSVYLASAPVSNKTFYYPNGRPELMINSGANVILLDVTDLGGPWTTLYQGTVVVSIDHKGDWDVLQHTGSTRDICTELS